MGIFSTIWDVVWTFFWIFAFIAYLIALFSIVTDLFRDTKLGGWAKAEYSRVSGPRVKADRAGKDKGLTAPATRPTSKPPGSGSMEPRLPAADGTAVTDASGRGTMPSTGG